MERNTFESNGWPEYRRQVLGDLQTLRQAVEAMATRQEQMRTKIDETFNQNRTLRDQSWSESWSWRNGVDIKLTTMGDNLQRLSNTVIAQDSVLTELQQSHQAARGMGMVGKILLPFAYAFLGALMAWLLKR